MTEERRNHLELVAASLTQAYYSVHGGGSPEHRDIVDTYRYLFDALVDYDRLGHSNLTPTDGLAPFVDAKGDKGDW